MTKTKLLTIFVVCLFVLNIFLVSNAYLSKSHTYHHERNRTLGTMRYIIDALDLNDDQVLMLIQHIRRQSRAERSRENEYLRLKQKIYCSISIEDHNMKDSLFEKMGKIQAEIDSIRYKYFLELKVICHKNQIPKFESLCKTIGSMRLEYYYKER